MEIVITLLNKQGQTQCVSSFKQSQIETALKIIESYTRDGYSFTVTHEKG